LTIASSFSYDAVRRVLAELADERYPLPGPEDQEALRSPVEIIWARRVTAPPAKKKPAAARTKSRSV
jgi:hypothetical protein